MRNIINLDDYKDVIDAIYKNKYFTNHGPLAQRLEREIEEYCKFKNVITIGADDLALLIALKGVAGGGGVLIPEIANQNILDIMTISRVSSYFYSKKKILHQEYINNIDNLLTDDIVLILIFETASNNYDALFLNNIVNLGIKVVIYSEKKFESGRGKSLGKDITFVYPLRESLDTSSKLEGGIIATNHDYHADVFRNIRSSYGVKKKINVLATCNGRFSELQAGLGLVLFKRLRSGE